MANNEEETTAKPQEEAAEQPAAPEEAPQQDAEQSEQENEAERITAELSSVKDQLLRTMAEYDNYRKRTTREKGALRSDIICDVTSKFLPVMDNLERALAAECSDENYKSGVQMIYDSFMEILKSLGVEEIESDGAQFDPQLHQAVQRVDDESAESGCVAKTFAKGYKINDKVIRFAVVAVAN